MKYKSEKELQQAKEAVHECIKENEGKKVSKSYPYIVVKTEMIDKPVVFE